MSLKSDILQELSSWNCFEPLRPGALEGLAEKLEQVVLRNTAERVELLEAALMPFATHAIDEENPVLEDLLIGLMKDRIVDWFGPSDFRAARAAMVDTQDIPTRIPALEAALAFYRDGWAAGELVNLKDWSRRVGPWPTNQRSACGWRKIGA
jgi:hypothetical protein